MKAKFIFIVIACLSMIMSCTKNNEVNNKGQWILRQKEYDIIKTKRSNTNGYFILSGIDKSPSLDTLHVYFSSKPTVSGKFKVVPFLDEPILSFDEIGIKIPILNGDIYYSTGIANMDTWPHPLAEMADVTIQDEKIKVEIPKMLTIVINSTGLDSVYLQASFIE